jgi:PAT family beta-lactamase induction signal transducer AmpG
MLKKIFSYRMLIMLLLGYCSGLPLLLTASTLQAWMTNEGVSLTAIGMVSLISAPYTFKFLWAPLLDRYTVPFLGRRRGWMFVSQLLTLLSILGLSFFNPQTELFMIAVFAFLIAFFSASQDIVIDAYRREIVVEEELGFASSLYVNGYRLAMLVSGAFALFLADQMPWKMVYQVMAMFMLPAMIFTLISPKEQNLIKAPVSLKEAVVEPLKDFFSRRGALIVLIFIMLYKVGDNMASNMTTPFILKIGYSKTDIATVAKTFGMGATLLGALIGGMLMLRLRMKTALIIFGILQAISTLGFSFLPSMPIHFTSLALIIGFENLAAGMGGSAYTAYMASLTNRQFTATQYALLSSLMAIPRVILSSPTGKMAEVLGWEMFFVVCTLVAIPGLLLLIPVFKLEKPAQPAS